MTLLFIESVSSKCYCALKIVTDICQLCTRFGLSTICHILTYVCSVQNSFASVLLFLLSLCLLVVFLVVPAPLRDILIGVCLHQGVSAKLANSARLLFFFFIKSYKKIMRDRRV